MRAEHTQPTLREKQRQERLELLLQAAEQIFVTHGYRDTSMEEIAARVGIGTATIYSHFPSKEDLMVAAILERDIQKVAQHVQEISNEVEGNVTEKLSRIFHFLVESEFLRRRVEVQFAMGGTPEAQKALLSRKKVFTDNANILSNALISLIERGKVSGDFRIDVTTSTMLKAFIGLARAQSVTDSLLNKYTASNNELLLVYLQGITLLKAESTFAQADQ